MTNRMVGSVLTLLTLLFSAGGGAAQTYTQMQWGMNKGVTPYAFGANINGTWRDLGTVSAAGVWSIPSSSLSFTALGAGAITRPLQTKVREIEVALEDYKDPSESTYDNAFARVLAAYPGAVRIAAQPGATYNFAAPIVLSRGDLEWYCKTTVRCFVNFAHAGTGLSINEGTARTFNVTTTNASVTATVSSATGLTTGMNISATGIPDGATITNIAGTTITLSSPATVSGTNAAKAGNKIYNVSLTGLAFLRSVSATSGCDIVMRNGGYHFFTNIRFFSTNNSISSVCGTSVQDIYFSNMRTNNVKSAAYLFDGASTGLSGWEAQTIGVYFDSVLAYYAHQTTVNGIANQRGVIEFGDYTQGIFVRRPLIAQSPAYGISLRGTVPFGTNGSNALVFIEDANIEASTTGMGGIAIENYAQIDITHGWFGGYSAPALYIGPNSSDTNVTGLTIYRNGTSGYTVECKNSVKLNGNQFIAYSSLQYVVGVYSGCDLSMSGGSVYQYQGGVFDDASANNSNARVTVTGVDFRNTVVPFSSPVFGWARSSFAGNSTDTGRSTSILGSTQVDFLASLGTATFNSALRLKGSSTGLTTIGTANSSATDYTATLPANTGTIAELNLAQTFSANQTFGATNLRVAGSSTGVTTLGTANSGATDYTATLPANTGTVAELNLAQTFSAAQTFSSAIISAGTSPTATGSGGTCAAGAVTGGALVGTVTLTAVCASTDTLALTNMPAATTGYVCDAADRTNGSLNLVQTATTTTGATFTFNATTGATDVIQFKCIGY